MASDLVNGCYEFVFGIIVIALVFGALCGGLITYLIKG